MTHADSKDSAVKEHYSLLKSKKCVHDVPGQFSIIFVHSRIIYQEGIGINK